MKRNTLFILILLFSITVKAQVWEIGVTSGAMGYMGDLNQNKYFKLTNLAYGGMVKKNIDGYWSVKLSVLKGQIEHYDSESKHQQERDRNLRFFTPLTEASLQVEFNFFNYGRLWGEKRVTPFVFSGISGIMFNPQAKLNNETYELKNYRTEGQTQNYKTNALAVPFGVGVKVSLSTNFNLIGEFGYRTAFTDYLDDVSAYYPTATMLNTQPSITAVRTQLSNRNIGVAGTQRGDFRKNDTYMFGGITLSYTFVSQKCYSF